MKMQLTTALALALIGTYANADVMSSEAVDNSTVQPGGVRGETSNSNFFNIEGDGNGTFASFGVVDFDGSQFFTPGSVSNITSISLSMTQANAGFSTDGPVSIYWTDATAAGLIDSGDIEYQAGSNGMASVDPLFTGLTLLGSGTYVVGTSGDVDMFTLTPGAAEADLIAALNAGSTIRLVITPDADDTAATYAGFSNSSADGPTLTIDSDGTAVPEPGSLALLGLGGLLIARRRRA